MSAPRFADRLSQELHTRRSKNPRYSLRAFAAWLGADHSTLSQILRGRRGIPARQLRAWAKKIGLDAAEAAVWVAIEHGPSEADRHWTAEAIGIITDRVHWQIHDL